MATRKRNEWLDAEESDEDDRGYDSADESRAKLLSSSKRIKLAHSPDAESGSESEDEVAPTKHEPQKKSKPPEKDEEYEDVEARLPPVANSLLDQPSKSRKKVLETQTTKAKSKSGVIYISRVPPFMKPTVVRNLLSPYGEIGRIFLTPEDANMRSSRLKSGGSRRKLFLDGWVEFLSKKDAKFVAENLNAQTIGGKKRSRFHDEVWNIKYLKGLKWHHLVEQIANENAERAARMRAEISLTTRENKMFLENVERAKMLEGMEAKKKRKEEPDYDIGNTKAKRVVDTTEEVKEPRRVFKQNEVKLKADKDGSKTEDVQRVLSKIF
jgi:ESF2/ABP1 family protein